MATKVIAKQARLSYANLLTPRAQNPGDPELYSVAVLIPKSDTATVEAIKASIKEAIADGVVKKFAGKKPANLRIPLRDGDTERDDDETYAGHWFINAKGPKGGKERPILLDKQGNETLAQSVIYSGVEASVALQFYAYDVNGNKGIAAGVVSLMSHEMGEDLSGTVATAAGARADFGIETPASAAASELSGDGTTTDDSSDDDDDIWG